ncbi:MAG: hypothetical protein ACKOWF_06245 [Chloroflexota bacterium]
MEAFIPGAASAPVAQTGAAPSIEDVLDEALRLAADHHRALGQHLGRPAYSPSLAALRQSPLGRDLRLLAAAAGVAPGDPASAGTLPAGNAPAADVSAAARRVRDLLLRPMAADGCEVPAWFWASDLGRVIARAERAAAGADAWLTPDAAAAALGIGEAEALEWVATGLLPWLPDEDGRPAIARAAVDRMRLLAGRTGPERQDAIPTAA